MHLAAVLGCGRRLSADTLCGFDTYYLACGTQVYLHVDFMEEYMYQQA